ncbi:MAG TPA: hypothetical protein VGD36_03400 [Xanthobacteraceae bacterium]|jgi:hypothetical protein
MRAIVSAEIIELGRETLSTIAAARAAQAPQVRCQLLASRFFEALKQELARTPISEPAKFGQLAAAVDQCRRIADPGMGPEAALGLLRATLLTLSAGAPLRPRLQLIQGGLAAAG